MMALRFTIAALVVASVLSAGFDLRFVSADAADPARCGKVQDDRVCLSEDRRGDYARRMLLQPSSGAWAEIESKQLDDRAERTATLRQRAKVRFEAEGQAFSASDLADIAARYRSAFRSDVLDGLTFLRLPEAETILQELIRRYPESNRAGCALVLLAQQATGAQRERLLRQAIEHDRDAWFENGVQVPAVARAMLAIHLAGLERFEEAEKLAAELVERFPGAIDQSGATLDDTLIAIRQLRRLDHLPATRPPDRPLQPTSGAKGVGGLGVKASAARGRAAER